METVHKLSDILYSFKHKLTDNEYKQVNDYTLELFNVLKQSNNTNSFDLFDFIPYHLHNANIQHRIDLLDYVVRVNPHNRDIVMAVVKKNGESLQYASDILKNSKEIVMEAVNQNGYAIKYASDRLKDDIQVVIPSLKKTSGHSLQLISERLRDNEEVEMSAISISNESFTRRRVIQ